MTIDEIKEKLIRNKAIHDQQVLQAKNSIESIRNHLRELSDEDYEVMRDFGIPIDVLRSVDLERLSLDNEYLEDIKSKLKSIVEKSMKKLEEEIIA